MPKDLPPGFQGMPAEDLAELKQELSADDFSVESVFAFMEPNNFELLLGLTTPLQNQQAENQFEQILAEPEVLRKLVTDGMGETQILEQTEIEELDDIGESVAGVTLKLNLEGVPANLDIVAFRREAIGAFVFSALSGWTNSQNANCQFSTYLRRSGGGDSGEPK
jgi:hypothetical protein